MNLTRTSPLNTNSLYPNKNIVDNHSNSQDDPTAKSFGSIEIDNIVRKLGELQSKCEIFSRQDICYALDHARQILYETKNKDSVAIRAKTDSKSDVADLLLTIKHNEVEASFKFVTEKSTLGVLKNLMELIIELNHKKNLSPDIHKKNLSPDIHKKNLSPDMAKTPQCMAQSAAPAA